MVMVQVVGGPKAVVDEVQVAGRLGKDLLEGGGAEHGKVRVVEEQVHHTIVELVRQLLLLMILLMLKMMVVVGRMLGAKMD